VVYQFGFVIFNVVCAVWEACDWAWCGTVVMLFCCC